MVPEQPATPGNPWLARFRALSRPAQVVTATAVVLVGCCVLGSVASALGGGKGSPSVRATQAPAGPTATPRPTATATPKPQPKVVFHQAGNGEKQTQTFTVAGDWRLDYTCSGVSSYLDSAPLYITVERKDGGYTSDDVMYTCPQAGGADSSTFHDGGTFYLHVISGISWEVTVTDLPD